MAGEPDADDDSAWALALLPLAVLRPVPNIAPAAADAEAEEDDRTVL